MKRPKEGEAVFGDLAQSNRLLSRSGACSTAPFHRRLLNLLLGNEPLHFSKSVCRMQEGESIISVLASVGWPIPLYTLPYQSVSSCVYHDESPHTGM